MKNPFSRIRMAAIWKRIRSEGEVVMAGFTMTAREREGLMLVIVLFVIGLLARGMRWVFRP